MIKDYSELTSRIYTQLSPELSLEFHNMLTEMAMEISRLYEIENAKLEDKAKAFDLINEKRVDIKTLHWAYPNVEAYNVWVRENNKTFWRKELTPEEFEFIGRLAGAK